MNVCGLSSLVMCSLLLTLPAPAPAWTPPYLGLGDSIGEGVQSGDANLRTQPNCYVNQIARKLGVPMPLPLIRSSPIGQVGELATRSRLSPNVVSFNLAVSGADVGDLIRKRSDAASPDQFDTETDLVLFPKLGSQLEIAEFYGSAFATCWIGNNDVLGAAIDFDRLDASQMTPVDEFRADFEEIVTRMHKAGIFTIYGNIPNVTSIAFLMGPDDLMRLTGSSQGLAEGEFTSMVSMLLLRMGLVDSTLLDDPDWVLDRAEATRVQERVDAFNQIIVETCEAAAMPYVDFNAIFKSAQSNPPIIMGFPVEAHFGGGAFSLDGIHPSNVGQLIVAQAFIAKANESLGTDIPTISDVELSRAMLRDPFQDKDGDGRVAGRPGAGLYETLMFLVGISGDVVDYPVGGPRQRARRVLPTWDGELFKRFWLPSKGLAGKYTEADLAFTIWVFKLALGLDP